MDHYAPTHDLAQPWRTRTLIATAVAAVELLALVGLGVAVLGKSWFHHTRTTTATSPARHPAAARPKASKPAATPRVATPPRPMATRAHTGVLVLNGNGQNGAAGAEARALRTHGYSITAVGNAKRSDYAASIVMYRPGYSREARRLAHDAGITVVAALDGLQLSQLGRARLVVVTGK